MIISEKSRATVVLCLLMVALPVSAFQQILWPLWDRFEVHVGIDDDIAYEALREILEVEPKNPRALRSAMDLHGRQDNTEKAFHYSERLIETDPGNEQLRLQHGYFLNSLGKRREALEVFRELRESEDESIRTQACDMAFFLWSRGWTFMPAPYFMDLYMAPSYETLTDAFIFPARLRAGRSTFWNSQGQVYGFINFSRDSRSRGGSQPQIINDNSVVVGVGVNYRFNFYFPLTPFYEVGKSFDLIDRNRGRSRNYIAYGVTSFKDWGDRGHSCSTECYMPWTWYTDFYGSISAKSLDDYNIIADFRLRPGINVARSRQGNTRLYAHLRYKTDTDGEFFNNVFEAGPGIEYRFTQTLPITVRLEALTGVYLGDPSPTRGSSYNNLRIEMVYFKSF